MKSFTKEIGSVGMAGYKHLRVNDNGKRIFISLFYANCAHTSLFCTREGNKMTVVYDRKEDILALRFPQYFSEAKHNYCFENFITTESQLEKLVAEILEWF